MCCPESRRVVDDTTGGHAASTILLDVETEVQNFTALQLNGTYLCRWQQSRSVGLPAGVCWVMGSVGGDFLTKNGQNPRVSKCNCLYVVIFWFRSLLI